MEDAPIIHPYREPLHVTLTRNALIAIGVGGILAWRTGAITRWPVISLLTLWPALGGHFVELFFLNFLRPKLSPARPIQIAARFATWFTGGLLIGAAVILCARPLNGFRPIRWQNLWLAGLIFIAIELTVHLILQLRQRPNFYNGRG